MSPANSSNLSAISTNGIVWRYCVDEDLRGVLTPHGSGDEKEPRDDEGAHRAGREGIRRATRKLDSAEEKIRVVLSGLRDDECVAELAARRHCPSLHSSWSKEFQVGLPCKTRPAGELKDLYAEAVPLKGFVAYLTLEDRLLKKASTGPEPRPSTQGQAADRSGCSRVAQACSPASAHRLAPPPPWCQGRDKGGYLSRMPLTWSGIGQAVGANRRKSTSFSSRIWASRSLRNSPSPS